MDVNYGLTALQPWEFGQSLTQLLPLGTRVKFYNPSYGYSEFIYCVFDISINFGLLVKFDQNFLVKRVSLGELTIGQPVYVNVNLRRLHPPETPITYGWVCSRGLCIVKGVNPLSVDGTLYLSSTPGVASNAGIASNRLGNFQIVQGSTEAFNYDCMIENNSKIFIAPTMNRLFPTMLASCPQITLSNSSLQLGQTGNVVEMFDGIGNATGKFPVTFTHTNTTSANFAVIYNNGMRQK